MMKWSGRRVSVLLTAIAVLLWTYSVFYARLEIGHFGLIHGLPPTYFVALALLTVASAILWGSRERHGKLLCLQLVILIGGLWLIPEIAGSSPPFAYLGHRNLGLTEYVAREGHFNGDLLWYQKWAGSFVWSAAVSEVASVDFEHVMGVFPCIVQVFCLLPLYVFLKNVLGDGRGNYIWAGLWLFSVADWTWQGYFSPQAVALFLLLTLLALVTSPSIRRGGYKGRVLLGLAVVVCAALAMTHLLTSLVAACILAALALVLRSKMLALALVLSAVFVVCWDVIGAGGYILGRFFPGLVDGAEGRGALTLDPGAVAGTEVTGHFTGSASHVAVAVSRVVFSGIFAVIGVVGAIVTLGMRRRFSTGIPVLGIALAPMVLLVLSGHYGEELLHRLYLFALAPMAYFGAELLAANKRWLTAVVCLVLIVAVPFHVIAHYGNAAIDRISPAQAAGLHFFHQKTSEGCVSGDDVLGKMENVERYQEVECDGLRAEWDSVPCHEQCPPGLSHYLGISRQYREVFRFLGADTETISKLETELRASASYGLVYDSTDLELWVNDRIE